MLDNDNYTPLGCVINIASLGSLASILIRGEWAELWTFFQTSSETVSRPANVTDESLDILCSWLASECNCRIPFTVDDASWPQIAQFSRDCGLDIRIAMDQRSSKRFIRELMQDDVKRNLTEVADLYDIRDEQWNDKMQFSWEFVLAVAQRVDDEEKIGIVI